MKDLTIIVHDDYVERVVDSLHKEGIAEISDVERDRDVSQLVTGSQIPDIVSKCTEYDMQLSSVLDSFQLVSEEGGGIGEMISPPEVEKVERGDRDIEELFQEIDEAMEQSGDEITDLADRVNRAEEKVTELENLKKELELVRVIDVDLSQVGRSDFTVIRMGKTSHPHKLKKSLDSVDTSFHVIKKANEEEYAVLAGAYIRDRMEFEGALREGDVRVFNFSRLSGTPSEALDKVNKRIKGLRGKKRKMLKELGELKDNCEKDFLVLREELGIYRDKKEVLQKFGNTDATSVVKGWVPEDEVEEVGSITDKASDGHAVVMSEEPEDPDEVPVSLDNPSFIKPFELLTHMFAPPRYDEIDPTFILAPAFTIFFGLMLGDVVYGVLIVLTSVILLRGMGKVDEGTRNFSLVLLGIGVSTVIFGFIQGSYMGPEKSAFPNLLGFFGISYPTYLNSLSGDGPLVLLIISLIAGLAYINVGIFLSLVQHVHRAEYKQIVLENVSWWLLQPGGFILLSGKLFGWFQGVYTPLHYTLAGVMSVAGLILLLMRAKGLSFFELTGFIGDFLSFARILALGLATGGIALTVNVLADLIASSNMGLIMALPMIVIGLAMAGKGRLNEDKKFFGGGLVIALLGGLGILNPAYPFYILALFVVIGGHLANAVLQALGSFVHSLRLQYVEFFNYFYEGGGSQFSPFKPEREHTKYKEKDVMER